MSFLKRKKKADKTVLVITDFSKNSTNAILFAAGMFKDSTIRFKLLNIFESPDEKARLLISVEDIISQNSEIGLEKQSAEIASTIKKKNLEVSTLSASGSLKKIIGNLAQSEDISFIVAGIPADKYPCKELNNMPLMFMGQNRYPVLMVPENCSPKPLKNFLVLNLDTHTPQNKLETRFENIVSQGGVSKNFLTLSEQNMDTVKISSVYALLKENRTGILVIIPSAGDKLDRALLDYQIEELCPNIAALLNC